jgi:hypothetical protein
LYGCILSLSNGQSLMTLRGIPQLPAETARAAEAVFGRDHMYLKIGKKLDSLLAGLDLPVPLYDDLVLRPTFWPLSLASVLQYWEDLTDHQMANAVRTRLDLKYALHLPLDHPGFEPQTLCTFRQGLKANSAARESFQGMIFRLREFTVDAGKRRAEAGQIIDTLCLLSRAELVLEVMGNALEAVAARCPDWLLSNALPHWYKRYYQLPEPQKIPRDALSIESLLHTVGNDGQYLLEMIFRSKSLQCRELPEIKILQREWHRQFDHDREGLAFLQLNCRSCAAGFLS